MESRNEGVRCRTDCFCPVKNRLDAAEGHVWIEDRWPAPFARHRLRTTGPNADTEANFPVVASLPACYRQRARRARMPGGTLTRAETVLRLRMTHVSATFS